jgi:hypothetical protein
MVLALAAPHANRYCETLYGFPLTHTIGGHYTGISRAVPPQMFPSVPTRMDFVRWKGPAKLQSISGSTGSSAWKEASKAPSKSLKIASRCLQGAKRPQNTVLCHAVTHPSRLFCSCSPSSTSNASTPQSSRSNLASNRSLRVVSGSGQSSSHCCLSAC